MSPFVHGATVKDNSSYVISKEAKILIFNVSITFMQCDILNNRSVSNRLNAVS